MIAKKMGDGNYYLCIKKGSGLGKNNIEGLRNIFLVKTNGKHGYVNSSAIITLPKELIGKRLLFKLEFVDDKI